MLDKAKLTALATALGLTLVVALLTSPAVRADENPFSVSSETTGIVLAGEGASDDGKCGESKCGDSEDDQSDEGKCGDSEDDGEDDSGESE